jgi:GntR family transcriptional regulator
VPLYHQVAQVLRARIADGTYPPGARLPTEMALREEFGIARVTVRQALAQLAKDHLIEPRQGSGTYVRPDAGTTFGQRFRGSLIDLMAETKRARVVQLEIERAAQLPERIQRSLDLPRPRGTAIVRTRSLEGRVFAYTINYLAAEVGDRLDERELLTESLMWLLEQKVAPLATAFQSVRAQAADAEVATRLEIPIGAPVLYVERIVRTREGRPIEMVLAWYRGDVYEYTVTFDLDGGALRTVPGT